MPKIHISDWPPYSPADQARRDNALLVAKLMVNAALTAPVTGGIPQLEADIVYGEEEQEQIARKMEDLAYERERWQHIFLYEAVMVRRADVVLLLGNTRVHRNAWDGECGSCGGRPDCSFFYDGKKAKRGLVDVTDRRSDRLIPGPLCMMYAHNMGYFVGSAMMVAVRLYIDARPFMSVGLAAQKLGYCPNSGLVVGILLAAAQKDEFRDIRNDYHLVNLETGVDALRGQVGQSLLRPGSGVDYRAFNPEKDEKDAP